MKKFFKYFVDVLLGVDQFANTLLGGAPDETISARVGRNRDHNPIAHITAAVLDTIEPDHTANAIRHERDGSQQADAYKDIYDHHDYGFTVTSKDCDCDSD